MSCSKAGKSSVLGPCELLAQLQQQMILYMSGQAASAIETPQLGRVEFAKTDMGQIQMLMQQLAAQCIACGGTLPPGYNYTRRRPISIQAWP